MNAQDRNVVSRTGPIEIDWPLTLGYYGGVGLGIAFEVIEPPLALFIAAVPFLKMLNRPNSSLPMRIVSQVLQGAAKPVGGDSDSAIRLAQSQPGSGSVGSRLTGRLRHEMGSIWAEARALSRDNHTAR